MRVLWSMFFALLVSGCLGSAEKTPSKQWPHEQTWRLLEKDARVRAEVRKIVELLGQQVPIEMRADVFVEKYFPLFTRKRGVERWSMAAVNLSAEKMAKLFVQFDKIGLLKEIVPTQKSYKQALVYGATVGAMSKRLSYLKALWQRGIRFEKIVFLSCDRAIEDFELKDFKEYAPNALPAKKDWEDLRELPKLESTMMGLLWKRADVPVDLAKIPVDIVSVPMKKQTDGSFKRANTGDTIEYWLAQKPDHGTCFAVSQAPFIGYQDAIGRRWMPRDRGYETVGEGVNGALQNVAVLVDAIFRQMLFEIYHVGLINEKKLDEYLANA